MPTYDYRCTKGHFFELFHAITDDRAKRCPRCGARARRVPSGGAGLLFKGSGFYITDYRSTSYQEKARADKPTADAGAEKSTAGGEKAKPKSAQEKKKKKSSSGPGAGPAA